MNWNLRNWGGGGGQGCNLVNSSLRDQGFIPQFRPSQLCVHLCTLRCVSHACNKILIHFSGYREYRAWVKSEVIRSTRI